MQCGSVFVPCVVHGAGRCVLPAGPNLDTRTAGIPRAGSTGRRAAPPGAGGQGPDAVEEEESARSDQPTPPTKSCMKIIEEQQQVVVSCAPTN